jgi:hypothetical protein
LLDCRKTPVRRPLSFCTITAYIALSWDAEPTRPGICWHPACYSGGNVGFVAIQDENTDHDVERRIENPLAVLWRLDRGTSVLWGKAVHDSHARRLPSSWGLSAARCFRSSGTSPTRVGGYHPIRLGGRC